MFDFLAFKALREKRGTVGVYQLYKRSLLPQIQHSAALRGKVVQRDGKNLYVPDFNNYSIEYRVVSDTIILFVKGDSFDHFLRMVAASHRLLCSGFAGHKAPLRGAIGYGDLIFDPNSIWIGSAIEDAYCGESRQIWSGCSLTSACEEFISANDYIEKYKDFFETAQKAENDPHKLENILKTKKRLCVYDIPEQFNPKSGPVQYTSRKGYVLDWTLNVYEGAGEKAFLESKTEHAKKIIENTKAFEQWARKNNR